MKKTTGIPVVPTLEGTAPLYRTFVVMPKILIVEDDKTIASFLHTILLGAGYTCVAASTADRARGLLESELDIALVLLDQNLGESSQSGLALLTALRQSPRYEHLPVIVCSGDSRPNIVTGFLGQKIVSFLRKPFRADRMLSDVERALGHVGNAIATAPSLAYW
jgi:two-component system, OmpR family, KDP operon response regulator KdpE